jgi:hypothetical protein
MLSRRSLVASGLGGVVVLGVLANAIYDVSLLSFFAILDLLEWPGWFWAITTAVFLVLTATFLLVSWSLYNSWGMANQLTELDDSLLRLLPSMVHGEGLESRLIRVIEEFLRDCALILGKDLQRAMLLVPKDSYLIPLAGFEMSEKTMRTRRFYVGADASSEATGTAGRAFREHRLKVVNLQKNNGQWLADDQDYTVFDHDRPHPPQGDCKVRSIVDNPFLVSKPEREDNDGPPRVYVARRRAG